jgi:DNA-binding MarR family transcriptional regulator
MVDRDTSDSPRRFEIVVSTDENGFERLDIERLTTPARPGKATEDQLEELACRIYETRRARARFFKNSLFGEPAWDILLALYCLPTIHKRLSVTDVCNAADVPYTTGMRYIHQLEQEGLLLRIPDRFDGRRVFIELAPQTREHMRHYLSGIYQRLMPE